MRYLSAIEAGDFKQLPGGIFNRSFIRAYARYVEYDEDKAISEYAGMMREQSDSPDDVSTRPLKSLVYTEVASSRSPLWTLFWAILILVALSLSIVAGLHFYQRRTSPKTAPGRSNHHTPQDKTAAVKSRLNSRDANFDAVKEDRNAFAG
jgi:cytoskeletal protein RodZ